MNINDFLNDTNLIEQARKSAETKAENYRKQREEEFKKMAFEQLEAKFLAEEKSKIDKEFEERTKKFKEEFNWEDVKFEPIEDLPNPETFNSTKNEFNSETFNLIDSSERYEKLVEFIKENGLTNPSHEEKNMIIRYAYDELGYRFKSTADWYNEMEMAIDEVEKQYDELMDTIEIERETTLNSNDKIINGSLLE